MNFDEAIAAHSRWKQRLRTYIAKPDSSLKATEVALDNKCELGQWIHGEGRKYASLPEFVALTTNHARFHKAAADLIRRADRGEKVENEVAVGARNEFTDATSKVIAAIVAMKAKA